MNIETPIKQSANREHKNSVFVKLFSAPDKILQLYNAVSKNSYPPETKIEIATLENALVNDIYNDLSFIIDGKLVVMIEHQSSINPNMPLRMLAYVVDVYDKLVDRRSAYSQKLIKIPQPEFIVLYNGKEEFPDEEILKLSDSFINLHKEHISNGSLELEVKVLNINKGRNEELIRRSTELSGYVEIINEIRKNTEAGLSLDEAVAKAVKDCANNNILLEFLNKYGGDVMSFLYKEWDLDECLAVRWEEGREEGREEGLEEGLEKGRGEGLLRGAKSMLNFGASPEIVAESLGLPLDKVISLQV